MVIVTGGAGFIGSNFVQHWFAISNEPLLNIDRLSYSGNLANLASVESNSNYIFKKTDICDENEILAIFQQYKPRAILHFAAESHVDRSIHSPKEFINTNIVGTFNLLECARTYWKNLPEKEKNDFRFLHVSTDEVYGSLSETDPAFDEEKKYEPNSPYSASKAASDHLVRSYFHTYGLPVLTTNCSNNYGPFQFPEKLIPLMICNALAGKSLPIYGDGKNVRDWLFVEDHCIAIKSVLDNGKIGEVYNIGGNSEMKNIDVVKSLCTLLDELKPKAQGSYFDQITYVQDRAGHDKRYAINATKIENALGWKAQETFNSGMKKTISWYLENQTWVQNILNGSYKEWIAKNYK